MCISYYSEVALLTERIVLGVRLRWVEQPKVFRVSLPWYVRAAAQCGGIQKSYGTILGTIRVVGALLTSGSVWSKNSFASALLTERN